MDAYLTSEMLRALTEGNIPKFVGYALIFGFLWMEVRGLKKEVTKLNTTIASSFSKSEERFKKIETKELDFEHRLTLLEHKT